MPTIMRTSAPVEELFVRNATARGLDIDKTPHAVQLAIQALGAGAVSPFMGLLEDLPSNARAFDWMSCALLAYAEFCDHTVVVDSDESTAPSTADKDPGETPKSD